MVRRATGTFAPACFLQETKGVCEPKTVRITIKGHTCYRSAREQSKWSAFV